MSKKTRLIKIVVLIKVMNDHYSNLKSVDSIGPNLCKHCLKARAAHVRGHVSAKNATSY